MAEIHSLNDSNWQTSISAKPALILLSNGEGVRGDFSSQFKKAAAESQQGIVFAEINPDKNPAAAQAFEYDGRPVMIVWDGSRAMVRRPRPWGSDVPLALEQLANLPKTEGNSAEVPATSNAMADQAPRKIMDNKPVNVTDADFQQMVIDASNQVPVLVDFWAEWCGPCRMVAPILEKMATEFSGKIRVAKVDTDANPGLSQYFRIMSIPTIMAFKDGQLVFNQAGALPEPVFRDLIQQLIALDVQAAIRDAEARQAQNPKQS